MKRVLIASVVLAMIQLCPRAVEARQVTLEPSAVLRLVDPNDAGDVKVLYKFELPRWLSEMTIVRAKLELSGIGDDGVPLQLEALKSAWSATTTWSALNSTAVEGEHASPVLVESAVDGETAVNMTRIVRGWIDGGQANYGVVISSGVLMAIDSGEALTESIELPTLLIVYTRDVED